MTLLNFIFLAVVVAIAYIIYQNSKKNSDKGIKQLSLDSTAYIVHYDGRAETGDQYPFDIVGESFHHAYLKELAGQHGDDSVWVEYEAVIQHEPNNPHDKNACAVYINGRMVGHLARNHAESWLNLLKRKDIDHMAMVYVKAVVTGGNVGDGYYRVRLDMPTRIANVGKFIEILNL